MNLNLAIVNSKKSRYSETFIQKHLDELNFNKFHYFGYYPQFLNDESNPINTGLTKVWNRLLGKVHGKEYWDYQKALVKSWQRERIQVILIEYGTVAMRILPALQMSKIPFIVHYHGYDLSVDKYLIQYDNYKSLWAIAGKFVVVSSEMYDTAINAGFPKDKLLLNPYGPADEFFKVVPEFYTRNLLSVGRFTEKKAPESTIIAFSQTLKNYTDAHLHMIGAGELEERCNELIESLGIQQSVTLHGIKSPEEIREFMSKSIALVQHSVTASSGDKEGTPLAILEAQAAGLPVISTRHAGIPDVVIENKTGLLCDEHDVDSMAANMRFVLSDFDRASVMGKQGRENIKANFSLARHINVLEDAINNVVESRHE